jgi:hypothetical protein
MLARIKSTEDIHSGYVVSKIGVRPADDAPEQLRAYEARYQEYYAALMQTYVDTTYVVKVPVFGFTVDVNDIGMIGGIGFAVLLTVFLYCVRREIDNLHISFGMAGESGNRARFYSLLAMRQVFTVPRHLHKAPPFAFSVTRRWMTLVTPKAFSFMPVMVHAWVVVHDIRTSTVGQQLDDTHTLIVIGFESFLTVIIATLTWRVFARMSELDKVWQDQWELINDGG